MVAAPGRQPPNGVSAGSGDCMLEGLERFGGDPLAQLEAGRQEAMLVQEILEGADGRDQGPAEVDVQLLVQPVAGRRTRGVYRATDLTRDASQRLLGVRGGPVAGFAAPAGRPGPVARRAGPGPPSLRKHLISGSSDSWGLAAGTPGRWLKAASWWSFSRSCSFDRSWCPASA